LEKGEQRIRTANPALTLVSSKQERKRKNANHPKPPKTNGKKIYIERTKPKYMGRETTREKERVYK